MPRQCSECGARTLWDCKLCALCLVNKTEKMRNEGYSIAEVRRMVKNI